MTTYFGRAGLTLLLGAAGLLTAGTARAEFTALPGWDRQIFPSYAIATATVRLPEATGEEQEPYVLGDRRGILGVALESPADASAVTVTISCDAIMEPSTFTGVLDGEGTQYRIFPDIRFKYDVLAKNKQSIPVTVNFRVEFDDEPAEDQTVVITLRSINDCPYAITKGGDVTDVSFTFAAYVNEQHPFVERIMREALDSGIVDSFTGYQSGDPKEVLRQAYALWDALSRRDLRYADITVTAAESQLVASQHVRLIDESINNSQANCVDGSVLMASLLRKIGIEPVLVFVPRHCYMGFYLDSDMKHLTLLETTMIGGEAGEEAADVAELEGVVDAATEARSSWITFSEAIAAATQNFAESTPQFEAANDPDYQVVAIAPARLQGILPIAFDARDAFVPNASGADDEDAESADDTEE